MALRSHTSARFREAFAALPPQIQRQARQAYRLFRADPRHPGLHFKQVHASRPIFSARVGIGYRALALQENDDLIWFWIGSHADYDRLLMHLR